MKMYFDLVGDMVLRSSDAGPNVVRSFNVTKHIRDVVTRMLEDACVDPQGGIAVGVPEPNEALRKLMQSAPRWTEPNTERWEEYLKKPNTAPVTHSITESVGTPNTPALRPLSPESLYGFLMWPVKP